MRALSGDQRQGLCLRALHEDLSVQPGGADGRKGGAVGGGGGGAGNFDAEAFFAEQDADGNGLLEGEEIHPVRVLNIECAENGAETE